MTLVLDNSLFSQKKTFKNDKIRSHEWLYFLFETQSIKGFSFLFELFTLHIGTFNKRVEWTISDWTNLEVKLRSAGHLSKPMTYIHIPVEVK